MTVERHTIGCVGNVWVKQNYLAKAGDRAGGHKHFFDHVSLLTQGSVRVEVKGFEPKVFNAPTFIVIKKEYEHDFVALEDGTLWYCIFALRDENGEVTDIYSGDNSPYSSASIGNTQNLQEATVLPATSGL